MFNGISHQFFAVNQIKNVRFGSYPHTRSPSRVCAHSAYGQGACQSWWEPSFVSALPIWGDALDVDECEMLDVISLSIALLLSSPIDVAFHRSF